MKSKVINGYGKHAWANNFQTNILGWHFKTALLTSATTVDKNAEISEEQLNIRKKSILGNSNFKVELNKISVIQYKVLLNWLYTHLTFESDAEEISEQVRWRPSEYTQAHTNINTVTKAFKRSHGITHMVLLGK